VVAQGGGTGPWWLVVLALAGGVVAGVVAAGRLAPAAYRHEDERDRPLPRHAGWLAPVNAVVWASLAWRFGSADLWPYLPAALYVAVAGLALTWIDLDVHRLPEMITLPSYGVVLVLLTVASAVTGDWAALLRAAIAAVLSWLAYFLLALLASFVSPGGLGFGDVMLSGILGMLVGWLGWDGVVVAPFAAFLLAGLVALVLLLTRRATRHTHIAFGPFMVAGALVALLVWPAQVLSGD